MWVFIYTDLCITIEKQNKMCQCQPSSPLRIFVTKMSSWNGKQGKSNPTWVNSEHLTTEPRVPVYDHWRGKALGSFLGFLKRFPQKPSSMPLNRLQIPVSQESLKIGNTCYDEDMVSALPLLKLGTCWYTILHSWDFWESKATGRIFHPLGRLLAWSSKEWCIQQCGFCCHGHIDGKVLSWWGMKWLDCSCCLPAHAPQGCEICHRNMEKTWENVNNTFWRSLWEPPLVHPTNSAGTEGLLDSHLCQKPCANSWRTSSFLGPLWSFRLQCMM